MKTYHLPLNLLLIVTSFFAAQVLKGYGRTMRTIPFFIRRKVRAGHFMTVEPPAHGGIMTWEAASGLNGSR